MKILIAEDEPDLLEIFQEELVRAGFEVTTVENGLVAFDELCKKPFDVLITDIKMPKMNGIQLIKSCIEKNLSLKGIVVVSGNSKEDLPEFPDFHPLKILLKPFRTKELIDIIRSFS